MGLSLTEELRVPGLRVLHPSRAEIRIRELETRRYRVRRVSIRGPWMTSKSDPTTAARYQVRVLIFEDPGGSPVGDLLAEGRVQARPGRFRLVEGELGGREAVIREPVDPTRTPQAAYVTGSRRFFYVEWTGPADPILETLELEPSG